MGKIIGFCNQKGGTAKTTSVVNAATFLAVAGKKVLLIDSDPQGNASSAFGIDKNSCEKTFYELICGTAKIKDVIYKTEIENLKVIPSNTSLAALEIELVSQMSREYFFKNSIKNIKDDYDYILFDAPPSLGLISLNILSACNSVIIPIQCEYYALEGVSRLVHTLDMVKDRLNPELEIEGILMTMADFRTKLTIQVIEEVRKFFNDKVYDTVIPRNVKLSEAPSFGKPIYLYDKLSIGAKAYFKFICEFLKEDIKGVYDGKVSLRERSGVVDTEKERADEFKHRTSDERIFVY